MGGYKHSLQSANGLVGGCNTCRRGDVGSVPGLGLSIHFINRPPDYSSELVVQVAVLYLAFDTLLMGKTVNCSTTLAQCCI